MNELLNLIKTDEERMKIVAELLLDDGLMQLILDAIKSNSHCGVMPADLVEDAPQKAELLYRVLDSYRYPESYFEDIWERESETNNEAETERQD